MANEIKIVNDNTQQFLAELERVKQIILLEWGLAGEKNAKVEITRAVYDTPQSDNYRRTGNLRNSLTHQEKKDETVIGTNVEYGKYVELGTSRGMKPRPFLRPAIEEHIDEYRKILESRLKG